MSAWSKLQKSLYLLIDEKINFQIHCSIYRMKSQYGGTDLPRYWITLNKEIIFDYPKQFVQGETDYPYLTQISEVSSLIREYINTDINELFDKTFENDKWGLTDIFKAADKRIGERRFDELISKTNNTTVEKIISARKRSS